ncbi:dihydrofolate reductase [Sphingomonas montana]|uniref:dihydrofolate reductase n=1 Tax=Sphingomonas montana TaxID=1843236 RepID=UPI00096C7636|nr:dihydrofolate reductase [Sphingomonas montana]
MTDRPAPPSRPYITLVLARASNGAIGRDGTLPWHLPADLRHFKRVTAGTPMVMGRRTFDSLPGLLPHRRHIVLTRDRGWGSPGAEPVATVADALAAAGQDDRLSVIGGAEIHTLFEPLADRIELTHVHATPAADTFVPLPDPAIWREDARTEHPAEGAHPAYAFATYLRHR